MRVWKSCINNINCLITFIVLNEFLIEGAWKIFSRRLILQRCTLVIASNIEKTWNCFQSSISFWKWLSKTPYPTTLYPAVLQWVTRTKCFECIEAGNKGEKFQRFCKTYRTKMYSEIFIRFSPKSMRKNNKEKENVNVKQKSCCVKIHRCYRCN